MSRHENLLGWDYVCLSLCAQACSSINDDGSAMAVCVSLIFFVLYCICLSRMFSDESLGGWTWHVLMGRGWSLSAYRMLIFAKLNQQLYSEGFALNY